MSFPSTNLCADCRKVIFQNPGGLQVVHIFTIPSEIEAQVQELVERDFHYRSGVGNSIEIYHQWFKPIQAYDVWAVQ